MLQKQSVIPGRYGIFQLSKNFPGHPFSENGNFLGYRGFTKNKTPTVEKQQNAITYDHPTGNDTFKVNNRSTKRRCEICSQLTIKTPDTFIVNFGHISHLVLAFLLLTLSK